MRQRTKRRSLSEIAGSRKEGGGYSDTATIQIYTDTLNTKVAEKFENDVSAGLSATVDEGAKGLYKLLKAPPKSSKIDPKKAGINFENISGNLFELALTEVGGKYANGKDKGNATFDFPSGIGDLTKAFGAHGGKLGSIATDAKRSINYDSIISLMKKGKNTLQDLNERLISPKGYKQKTTASQKRRNVLAAARGGSRPPKMKLTAAARGLQRSQVEDPDYWTDDGNLKAILMPGELVSYGANPVTARQVGAGNVGAVRSLNPRNTSVVPGSGNRDTFPMDLPPGTVVVPKSLSLATGGKVGRGRVKMSNGWTGSASSAAAGSPMVSKVSKVNQKIMQQTNANFGQLADAAVGVAFSLQMMDFSSMQGMLISIGQLSFVIPSAMAAFKEIPAAMAAASGALSAAGPKLLAGGGSCHSCYSYE